MPNTTASRRVFVTGGSGFVGRQLVRTLVARGDQVVALARSHRAAQVVAGLGAEVALGELEDVASLQRGMAGCAVTFHLAAKTNEWGPRADFYVANVAGTQNVIAATRAAAVPRLVHMSTEAVLAGGDPVRDADELAPYPPRPVGPYPWSKQLGEAAVRAASGPALHAVVLRPRVVWGRDDSALLPALTEAMRQQRWIWWGEARHPTSVCHVRNLCEATLLAAERGAPGEVYFVTDGVQVPMRDFLEDLVRTQGVTPTQWQAPRWLGWQAARAGEALWRRLALPGQPPIDCTTMNLTFEQVTVDDRKARRLLGYVGPVTRAQGMAELRADAEAAAASATG